MSQTQDEIRTLDLFSGAGGLSLGFELAGRGFKPVQAVEMDKAAAASFEKHFKCQVHVGRIEHLARFKDADVIIGGPPCQGFSPLGRDRDEESRAALNELWREYLRAVREVQPRAFIIENVPQFKKSAQYVRLTELMKTDPVLSEYAFNDGVVNAADYGAPQVRKRWVFMAVRGLDEVPFPPAPTHGPEGSMLEPYMTVEKAFEDLPTEPTCSDVTWDEGRTRQDLHFGRLRVRPTSIERYKAIPEGGNRFDLARKRPDITPPCWLRKPTGTTDGMGRLWWNRPSGTIRTEFFKPEKGRFLHPTAHRPITHREAARLQSFPDTFAFEGNRSEIARQIGNAVPPLLGKALAEHLHHLLGLAVTPREEAQLSVRDESEAMVEGEAVAVA
ncbi:DNA cytosine methyltransferase [Geodermatophilus sp. SYSU D00710]